MNIIINEELNAQLTEEIQRDQLKVENAFTRIHKKAKLISKKERTSAKYSRNLCLISSFSGT